MAKAACRVRSLHIGHTRNGASSVSRPSNRAPVTLTLASPYDKSIYDDRNILNLVFSNVLGIEVSIEDHLYIGSDHKTLVISLLSRFQIGGQKLNLALDDYFMKRLKE